MNRLGLLLLFGSAAFAQQSVVEHCRQTSSDADRIACLEAALLAREPVPQAASQAASPAASQEALPAAPQAAPQAAAGIGAEQVIARSQTRAEKREALAGESGLAVSQYEVIPYERLLITLENGQVWRQIKGDTQSVRVNLEKNQTVDISESALGGYKLRLNEMRRSIRVERVQ
jgi:hypothetical protein